MFLPTHLFADWLSLVFKHVVDDGYTTALYLHNAIHEVSRKLTSFSESQLQIPKKENGVGPHRVGHPTMV